MTDLPEISDEMVDAFIADQAVRHGYSADPDGSYVRMHRIPEYFERTRAGLAAALVASGWRREADVLREAAEALEARYPTDVWHPASTSPDAMAAKGIRVACTQLRHLAAERDRATALEPPLPLPVADGPEAHVRITRAPRTVAAPVMFHEVDEPVADVVAAFEAGEKGVTKPPAGAPRCTCPLIDVSSTLGQPAFVLGDPAGCKVHGQARDAEIEAAKRRARG